MCILWSEFPCGFLLLKCMCSNTNVFMLLETLGTSSHVDVLENHWHNFVLLLLNINISWQAIIFQNQTPLTIRVSKNEKCRESSWLANWSYLSCSKHCSLHLLLKYTDHLSFTLPIKRNFTDYCQLCIMPKDISKAPWLDECVVVSGR